MHEQRPENTAPLYAARLSDGKTLPPRENYEPSENHQTMIGSNVIAKIEARITRLETIVESFNAGQDVLISRLDALKDSMDRQHSTLLWVIGIATALLGAIRIFTWRATVLPSTIEHYQARSLAERNSRLNSWLD